MMSSCSSIIAGRHEDVLVAHVLDLHQLHRLARASGGARELARFLGIDCHVVVAGIEQHRDLHLRGMGERVQSLHGRHLILTTEAVLVGGVDELLQIARPGARDGALVEPVGTNAGGQRRVAAVGIAEDTHALGVCDVLGDEPFDAVVQIVLHLLSPLAVAGAPELLSPALRATELRLDHREAARGEVLDPTGEVPVHVVARPRPTVRLDERRIWARSELRGWRQGEKGRDEQAVAGRILHQPGCRRARSDRSTAAPCPAA